MNDATAASAIQSWFSGNVSRNKMEETRVNSNLDKGGSGASSYQAESRLRRRSTMRLSKVIVAVMLTLLTMIVFRHSHPLGRSRGWTILSTSRTPSLMPP